MLLQCLLSVSAKRTFMEIFAEKSNELAFFLYFTPINRNRDQKYKSLTNSLLHNFVLNCVNFKVIYLDFYQGTMIIINSNIKY